MKFCAYRSVGEKNWGITPITCFTYIEPSSVARILENPRFILDRFCFFKSPFVKDKGVLREKEPSFVPNSVGEKDTKVEKDNLDFSDPNYETLARILKMAYDQASAGKGKERHANGRKFDDQPIMTIAKDHGLGYQTGQAEKKLKEAHTLLKLKGKEAAIRELLGAINYAAAAIAFIENMEEGETK